MAMYVPLPLVCCTKLYVLCSIDQLTHPNSRQGNSLEVFGPRRDSPKWEWLSSLSQVVLSSSTLSASQSSIIIKFLIAILLGKEVVACHGLCWRPPHPCWRGWLWRRDRKSKFVFHEEEEKIIETQPSQRWMFKVETLHGRDWRRSRSF